VVCKGVPLITHSHCAVAWLTESGRCPQPATSLTPPPPRSPCLHQLRLHRAQPPLRPLAAAAAAPPLPARWRSGARSWLGCTRCCPPSCCGGSRLMLWQRWCPRQRWVCWVVGESGRSAEWASAWSRHRHSPTHHPHTHPSGALSSDHDAVPPQPPPGGAVRCAAQEPESG
jgi:hypothetical protein